MSKEVLFMFRERHSVHLTVDVRIVVTHQKMDCSRDSTLHGTVDVTTVDAGKKYCVCFQDGKFCSPCCKCKNCENQPGDHNNFASMPTRKKKKTKKTTFKRKDPHVVVRFTLWCFCRGCVNIFVNNVMLMCENKLIMYIMFDVTLAPECFRRLV